MRMASGGADIRLILILFVGALLAIVVGNLIGQGEYDSTYVFVLIVIGAILLRQLRESFWIFIPFAMMADFPAIPIGGNSVKVGELWIIFSLLFVAVYWLFLGERVRLHIKKLWPLYLYALWAFVVYLRDPVGFGSFGASTGGLRFYVTIGLATIAAVILSNCRADPKSSRKIIILLIIAVLLEFSWKLASGLSPYLASITGKQAEFLNVGSGYGWSQLLAIVPAAVIPIIFGRYTISEILQPRRAWLMILVGLLFVMALLSGKRSLAILVFIYPCLADLLRGRFLSSIFAGTGAVLAFIMLLMLMTSGVEMPFTVKRVISVLPGNWVSEYDVVAVNTFRDTLNKLALRKIKQNPVLGNGFRADFDLIYALKEDPSSLVRKGILDKGDFVEAAGYASSSSWHNTWLGISADFGIPAAVIWAVVWIMFLWQARKLWMSGRLEPVQAGLLLAMVLWTFGDMIRSWQFGHSSLNFWTMSWRYGLLLALDNWAAWHENQRGVIANSPEEIRGDLI